MNKTIYITRKFMVLNPKDGDKKLMDELLLQIKEIIKNVPYSLEEKFVADGIEAIFNEAKKL